MTVCCGPTTLPPLSWELSVRVDHHPGGGVHTTIGLGGEFDASNAHAITAAVDAAAGGPLTIDMARMRFGDASTVGALTAGSRRPHGLVVVNPPPAFARVLAICGLGHLIVGLVSA